MSSIDLYPTLIDVAGISPPKGQPLDGVSLVPVFQGAAAPHRPRLFWHFPCYVGKAAPSSAVREGDFKLIQFFEDGGRFELYNLKSDPDERMNLVSSMPDKAAALTKTLQDWQEETGALLPVGPNPDYDPEAERPRGGQSPSRTQGGRKKQGKQRE